MATRKRGTATVIRRMMTGATGLEAEALRESALVMAAIVDDVTAAPAVRIRASVELRACLSEYASLLADANRTGAAAWGASRLSAV